jgi:hypothetical protein
MSSCCGASWCNVCAVHPLHCARFIQSWDKAIQGALRNTYNMMGSMASIMLPQAIRKAYLDDRFDSGYE